MIRGFQKIPLAISGLMLGLASGGNLVGVYGGIYKWLFGSISALIGILLILKFINFKDFIREVKNPLGVGTIATFPMALMVLATYVPLRFHTVGYGIWLIGLLIHCLIIASFSTKFIVSSFTVKNFFPNTFVVYVGVGVASITAPNFGLEGIGQVVFWFSTVCYLLLLPIIIYRVTIIKEISEPVKPTMTIFIAPGFLCLAGYLSAFKVADINIILTALLFTMSLITFSVFILIYFFRVIKLRFYPSHAALTFPFVISAIATNKAVTYFTGMSIKTVPLLRYFTDAIRILAILVVIGVLLGYLFSLLRYLQRINYGNTRKWAN
ncbi:potassium-tellurite ethidium and proflavin transporter [Peptococcaceae bacterium CEB3]|nr:potassium-tellurite ethidium and proflavin transporter [Peptococcaceae bacterium CEB3]